MHLSMHLRPVTSTARRGLGALFFSVCATAWASPGLAQVVPTDSLQNHWALDESSGTTATDSLGAQDGTLANGPVWRSTSGRIGGALEFDGVDDRVDLGTMDIPPGPGMTISLWMKADDFGVTDARLISKSTGTATQDHYWMVSTINSTALRFRLKTGGSTATLATTTGQLQAGVWYHVAVTYDGSYMRIYKDGVQVAITAKTGTMDTNASVGVAMGNQPAGASNLPFDGLIDDVRIYNRALSASEIQGMIPPPPPPTIQLWYGDSIDVGQLGVPQRQANVLGTVQEAARVDSLYYSLNGGPDSMLTVGPDGYRLNKTGDFNIELDYDSLNVGANYVVVTVVDTSGQKADTTVTVNYTDGATWALPDTLSFESATAISDEARVIDGKWSLATGGVRNDADAIGYDRLLVAGEGYDSTTAWSSDYEVLAPITIHQYITSGGRGAIGVGIGWQGHTGAEQPSIGHPYEAIAFIRDVTTSPILELYRVDNNGYLDVSQASTPVSVSLNTRYLMRVRSQAFNGDSSLVSVRLWQDGSPEPSAWTLKSKFKTRKGSVLLISHYAETTFGNTIIRPLEGVLNVATTGGGSVVRDPDLSVYPDSALVELTAVPDPGWVFEGWSGALSGNANPDTLMMYGDASVTASFGQSIVSDDFHSATLDTTLWRLFDPTGDATLLMSGTNVLLDVRGGRSHDLWSTCNCAPRLLQAAPNTDFEIEVKFDSQGSYTSQGQGIIVQENDDTYLRFDVVYSSGTRDVFAGYVNGGSASTKLFAALSPNAPYVRVTRTGTSRRLPTEAPGPAAGRSYKPSTSPRSDSASSTTTRLQSTLPRIQGMSTTSSTPRARLAPKTAERRPRRRRRSSTCGAATIRRLSWARRSAGTMSSGAFGTASPSTRCGTR